MNGMVAGRGRLAVLGGMRTPQAKAFGALSGYSAVDLGVHAAQAALRKLSLHPGRIDEVVFGNVAGPADAANLARVIALRTGVPADRVAHTVNRNCGSGMEAILAGWQALSDGRAKLVLAGGTESMSHIPWLIRDKLKHKLMSFARAPMGWQKLKLACGFKLRDWKPVYALEQGLTDPVCGLNMGQTAEVLAREFAISRTAQDEYALRSHRLALAASERCFHSGEISPLASEDGALRLDVGPRAQQSLDKLSKLRPVFDSAGTVTAGNSCPLTDGATALVLCREQDVAAYDCRPMGYVAAYSLAGCEPQRMGLGPVYATSKLLDATGLSLGDFDLIEMNEAFAAQVLACRAAFDSVEFAREELSRSAALGAIDCDRLNINGGALALGHPVGATGARMVLSLLRALQESGGRRGLATLCVGGGQGMAMLVET